MQGWVGFFVFDFFFNLYKPNQIQKRKRVRALIFFYNGLANSDSGWEVIRVSCMGTLL